MKRKIISAVAAATLSLSVTACGAGDTQDTQDPGVLEVSSGPLTVRVPEGLSLIHI